MADYEQIGGQEKKPIEIERKFLVTDIPKGIGGFIPEFIEQGYMTIGIDGSETRLRSRSAPGTTTKLTLTAKTKGALIRGEFETSLTRAQFYELWPSTVGKRLEKERYTIPYMGYRIELDEYQGSLLGLVTAEVEFADEEGARAFTAPDWFGEDVTDFSDYKNQALALKGIPETYAEFIHNTSLQTAFLPRGDTGL